jgi:hypothetical protein
MLTHLRRVKGGILLIARGGSQPRGRRSRLLAPWPRAPFPMHNRPRLATLPGSPVASHCSRSRGSATPRLRQFFLRLGPAGHEVADDRQNETREDPGSGHPHRVEYEEAEEDRTDSLGAHAATAKSGSAAVGRRRRPLSYSRQISSGISVIGTPARVSSASTSQIRACAPRFQRLTFRFQESVGAMIGMCSDRIQARSFGPSAHSASV